MASSGKRRPRGWRTISAELYRRRVYPVLAAYAVAAFVILQVAEITFEPLGLPNWAMIGLIALVIVGFPVVGLLAWLYDLTPSGIRKDSFRMRRDSGARPSIAVLPFADMSPDKDQAYFCEGIAEEILNALTKIRQLDVAARSSSFLYEADSVDVRAVGRELRVSNVLEGSVRKAGDRVRVTAQLVNTGSGYHVWSKTFDEELKDVFSIQGEIATSIAESLLDTLSASEQERLRKSSTSDVDAYDYYLRGRQFFKRFRKKDIEYARQMFRQALDIDAKFALAWAGYADCHSFLVMYADPEPGYRQRAQEASTRAVELAPKLAEAHASRGLAFLVREDYGAAEHEFGTAIDLNPRLFEAYYYFGRTRFHQGRLEEAIELFRKAAEVDPTDYQSRCLRIQVLRGLGRLDEARKEAAQAVKVLEEHLKWNPDDSRAYQLGSGTLAVLGETERTKEWLQRAIEIDPDDPVLLYNVACNLAVFGEIDDALDYLGQVVASGAISKAWMEHDEDLANLRGDPRFTELMQQIETAA